jgi:protein SCO1/2
MMRALAILLALAGAVRASPAEEPVGVDEQLGRHVPAALTFRDQDDREVRLSDLLGGGEPVLLVPAYYRCPMLCGLVLESAAAAARGLDWSPGRDYRLVTVSFDSEDRPAQARQKQAAVLAGCGDARLTPGTWPFLSADAATAARLLDALGIRVQRQPDGELAHPAVAVVLTPDGAVSRYLYGIALAPRDLRLALLEAGAGRSGASLERALLLCYRYDPATRRYGLAIERFMQLGALVLAAGTGLGLALLVRRVRARVAA